MLEVQIGQIYSETRKDDGDVFLFQVISLQDQDFPEIGEGVRCTVRLLDSRPTTWTLPISALQNGEDTISTYKLLPRVK